MELWKEAQGTGFVDEHYQPKLSRTKAALLADAMAKRLGIRNKWKVFGISPHTYPRSMGDFFLALFVPSHPQEILYQYGSINIQKLLGQTASSEYAGGDGRGFR